MPHTLKLHPATGLALSALEYLQSQISPKAALDMGCGSGILAVTAARIWDCDTLAADISPQAIADTNSHLAQLGGLLPVTTIVSDGFKHRRISEAAPYDLIMGNLLAQWHIAMARDMKNHLSEGGHILLSGILSWLAEGVREAFVTLNFDIVQEFSESPWHCYILRHNSKTTVT